MIDTCPCAVAIASNASSISGAAAISHASPGDLSCSPITAIKTPEPSPGLGPRIIPSPSCGKYLHGPGVYAAFAPLTFVSGMLILHHILTLHVARVNTCNTRTRDEYVNRTNDHVHHHSDHIHQRCN